MFSINNMAISNIVSTLTQLGTELAISNERLTTGLRVNRAVDDPSGIVALSNFNAEIARIDARTTNGTRINSIIDTADGAMAEIEDLLDTIDAAVTSASGDPANLATYQATIDTALNSIDSLVSTTSFNGDTLLNGGIGYTVTGVNSSELANVRVHSLDTASGDVSLEISTVAAAKAEIAYSGGTLIDDVTFTITGPSGSQEFNFATGTARTTIAIVVNAASAQTGVESEKTDYLYFRSTEIGFDQTVSINVTAGTFNMLDGTTSDTGTDVGVTINGAFAATSGNIAHYSSGNTAIDLTAADGFSGTATITVSGSGADWSLGSSASDRIYFGQSSLSTSVLGDANTGLLSSLESGGTNDLASGNFTAASDIAELAKSQVTSDRARIGAISSYAVTCSLNAYADAKTSLTTAKSAIEDLDYVAETANNNRLQLLIQMGTTLLATLNQSTTNILSLLGSS